MLSAFTMKINKLLIRFSHEEMNYFDYHFLTLVANAALSTATKHSMLPLLTLLYAGFSGKQKNKTKTKTLTPNTVSTDGKNNFYDIAEA